MEEMKMTFEELAVDKEIIKALHLLGFKTPTQVQQAVIPLLFNRQDVVVKAQTGSGKTAAFAIPLCQLVNWAENKPQALILEPTRELAMQVQEEVQNIGKFKRIKAPALYGQYSFLQQQKDLKQKSHIVIGTPGRVLDHLTQKTLPTEAMHYLIIDEADEMLKMGFMEQVAEIAATLPQERVTLLFSATMPKSIRQLSKELLHLSTEIVIEDETITPNRIEHFYYDCTDWDKISLLVGILMVRNPDSCIIFANTRDLVEQIYEELTAEEFTCQRLHGGMEQWERTRVMDDFKQGEFRYLVATDVAARGIDVENIELVVNFELPYKRESYVHRIGRTGRAGLKGTAISLAEISETKQLELLEKMMKLPIIRLEEPSAEAVDSARKNFLHKMHQLPAPKTAKTAAIDAEIMRLHIADGKKSKIRPVDIVGTICAIDGVEATDIGTITIWDWSSYVEILNHKGPQVLEALQTKPIKGRLRKVSQATPKRHKH